MPNGCFQAHTPQRHYATRSGCPPRDAFTDGYVGLGIPLDTIRFPQGVNHHPNDNVLLTPILVGYLCLCALLDRSPKKAVIVVLDTNVFVWHADPRRSGSGRTLLRLLRATNGRLFIPEILRREYIEGSVKREAELRKTLARTLSALDELAEFRFPNDHGGGCRHPG